VWRIEEPYVFFNGKTGVPSKDMSVEMLDKFNGEGLKVVSPDWSWNYKETPIALAADLMKRAKYRVLADSALYHIAHAMDLRVDLAYFGRGKEVWDRVHPLHSNNEKVIYG
jgi:hypothetical protein